jgi:signal transduction histidine kinase
MTDAATRPKSATRRGAAAPARKAAGPRRTGARGLIRAVLRTPLFYKLLVANAAVIALGAVAGTSLAAAFVRAEPERSTWELIGLLVLAGIVLSVMVNAAILRLALAPLRSLEETARRVQEGDVDARAPGSPLADRQLEGLTDTFNAMLESVAGYRRRLREVAARALNAAEEERKRIARELHDDTAQRLAALLIRLRIVRGMTRIEDRNRVLEEVRREITETLEGVRHFARGLRPPALDELGLLPAIQSYARSLAGAARLRIDVDGDLSDAVLSPEAELDALTAQEITELLLELRRATGMTVLFVDHDVEAACRMAERVVVLVHGRKVCELDPERVRPGEIRDLFRHPLLA